MHKPTVALMLNGHSIKELDDRIQEFKEFDWCWATMHRLSSLNHILPKIGKKWDLLFLLNKATTGHNAEAVDKACREAKTIVTGREEYFHYEEVIKFKGAIRVLSFWACLLWLKDRCDKVILFGADGYFTNKTHYNIEENSQNSIRFMDYCTGEFNKCFPSEDIGKMEIVNCSPGSKYTCLKTVTYDELLNDN